MFKFLKKKVKAVLGRFTKKIEEEAPEEKITVTEKEAVAPPTEKEIKEITKEEKPELAEEIKEEKEKKEIEKKEKVAKTKKQKKTEKEEQKEEKKEEKPELAEEIKEEKEKKEIEKKAEETKQKEKEEQKEEKKEEEKEKKGFFAKIARTLTTKKLNEKKFEELFWDLEIALLENNVAVEVIEKIKQDLKKSLVDKPIPRSKINETITNSLHKSIEELFDVKEIDLVQEIKKKKPYVICFVGINGSGKTTTIAKIANWLKKQGFSVVLAAADTFRAAAIDQLQLHADKLGVKLIKHDYGSDPAAVAFDAIKHAESTGKDVVLIDTAGRIHSNVNLLDEMKKIIRIAKPDLKIFVGESITGNDCVEQAKKFNESIQIDAIILSKADIDEKGGAAISISYVTKKPILFLGVGQEYKDLEPFDKERLLANLGL
ncbi:signal recognition particle-docking protein FtsY [Candidatus Woesearchaeota archaeon]|nr:MAG: signal recognition particle-docking protein FtsY [Candidatus Woesearchaeota archaeon ex4484_78]RLE46976.1 MAG: signal recognition particle-docking protein FtsY [Candidatus Woesearchaeota archaeon]